MNFPGGFPGAFPGGMPNINPKMAQMGANMMANMSDEQLANMMKMSGFGQMDPSLVKNMANKMAGNQEPQQQSQPRQEERNIKQESKEEPKKKEEEELPSMKGFPDIEELKKKGNTFFKLEQYKKACNIYLEALLEIEEIVDGNPVARKNKELQDLEISCRLNYCASKIRMGDYKAASTQVKKVLKLDSENGKAHFKLAECYFNLGSYEKADEQCQKADECIGPDSRIDKLKADIKLKLQQDNEKIQEDENVGLIEEAVEVKEDIEKLEKLDEEQDEQVRDLEEEMKEIVQMEEIRKRHHEQETEVIKAYESEKKKQQEKIGFLEKKIKEMESQLKKSEVEAKKKKSFEKTLQDKESQISDLILQIKKLEEQKSEKNDILIKSLESRIKGLMNDKIEVTKSNEGLKKSIEELKTSLEQAITERDSYAKQLADSGKEIEGLRNQNIQDSKQSKTDEEEERKKQEVLKNIVQENNTALRYFFLALSYWQLIVGLLLGFILKTILGLF